MKISGPDQGPFKKGAPSTGKTADKGSAAYAGNSSSAKDLGTTAQGAKDASARILVSDFGREVAKVADQVKKTPDVRAEKVKDLKAKIDSGSYYVSSDKIANKILEDVVKNG